MKKRFRFLIEIAIGLLISFSLIWAYFTRYDPVEGLSLKTYDFLSSLREPAPKSNIVKIIAIDEKSMNSLGRWPWPRSLTASLIEALVDYGAKVIGVNVFFTEENQDEGMDEIIRLHEEFSELLNQVRPKLRRRKIRMEPFEDFLLNLEDTAMALDGDAILARAIDEAGNIILPMYFQPGDPKGENLYPLPDVFLEEKLKASPTLFPELYFEPSVLANIPLEEFAFSSIAVGHSNLTKDLDGKVRQISPAVRYGDHIFPSFGVQLIREYKSLPREAMLLENNHQFSLRSFKIPIDLKGKTYLEFAGPAGTFSRFSALDVLTEAIPEKELNNKIVLMGVTAPGSADTFIVPSGESFNGLELWATHIDNILSQRFISRPLWAPMAEWGMIGISALFVVFCLPFVRARFSIPLAAVIFISIVGASAFFFLKEGLWITPIYGASLMATGFIVSLGRKLLFTEKGKEMVEAEGLETNKMLGLSFQGQGMLDLAFEKFRKCPIDDQLKSLLYNLALDMERKRQFSKAAAVYEHISTADPKYKDIQEKIKLLKKAGEGAVFGGLGKKGSDSTVVVEGLGQATTLGRYEVVRELGRGAMGIVYLGKDPKINRQVAIKTLRFEDEVDEDQAKSIKERFFREAESAGNLTHPNIIRIFDAGEDQDVAYIAMELIEGEDLKRCCEKANLLPIKTVLDHMAHVADALAYAHQQGVVHRDIKPGNIMKLKDGTLRITDFGIARIQATSKTATGAVLGTPAYMSPEQVNGKKVDGRADIFSLGVTLFEMLTGEKPFVADSIAALLYRIANVDHPDPREFNPNVPECIIPILNKALAKDINKRYQKANEMAQDIRNCISTVEAESSAPQSAQAPQSAKPSAPEPAPSPSPIPEPKPTPAPEPIQIQDPQEPVSEKPPKEEENFLSELQDVLKKPEDTPANPNASVKPEEKTEAASPGSDLAEAIFGTSDVPEPSKEKPKEDMDKTVALPPDSDKTVLMTPEDADKTIALDAGNKDIPMMDNIESTFHPQSENEPPKGK